MTYFLLFNKIHYILFQKNKKKNNNYLVITNSLRKCQTFCAEHFRRYDSGLSLPSKSASATDYQQKKGTFSSVLFLLLVRDTMQLSD